MLHFLSEADNEVLFFVLNLNFSISIISHQSGQPLTFVFLLYFQRHPLPSSESCSSRRINRSRSTCFRLLLLLLLLSFLSFLIIISWWKLHVVKLYSSSQPATWQSQTQRFSFSEGTKNKKKNLNVVNRIPATYGYSSDTLFFSIVVSSLSTTIRHRTSFARQFEVVVVEKTRSDLSPTDSSPLYLLLNFAFTNSDHRLAGRHRYLNLSHSLTSSSIFKSLLFFLSPLHLTQALTFLLSLSLSPVWSSSQVRLSLGRLFFSLPFSSFN